MQFKLEAQVIDDLDPEYYDADPQIGLPATVSFISDFENIFSFSQLEELENLLSDYAKRTQREIAVFTLKSMAAYEKINAYASRISKDFRSDGEQKNDGLTILFCNNSQKVRILTGSETQKVLTDDICNNIIEEVMLPEIRNGNHYLAMEKGISEIIKKWN